jgi:uncharacterized protein (DUF433 family)
MAEKTVKTPNYSAEVTAKLIEAYNAGESVATLAETFGKTARSIIAKLSREGVYKAKEYTTKTGEKPVKKDATADAIGKILRLSEGEIDSLTKANKTALKKIFEALANSKPIAE